MFDFEVLQVAITDPDLNAKINALGQKGFAMVGFQAISGASSVNHSTLVFAFERDNRPLMAAPSYSDFVDESGIETINKDTGERHFTPFRARPIDGAHAATESPVELVAA